MQQFIAHGRPGTYVRVLESGNVTVGDTLELVENSKHPVSVTDFFNLLFDRKKNQEHLNLLVKNEAIALYKREQLQRFIK
jgi:MOSC domain-containing protein YiiM